VEEQGAGLHGACKPKPAVRSLDVLRQIHQLHISIYSTIFQHLFQSQNMLAWSDALDLVSRTGAGVARAGWSEVNNVFVMRNTAGRNSITIFKAGNA